MNILEIMLGILSFLFVALTSLVTWIYSNAQKDTQKRFEKNELRMDGIEDNYLTRFEKLNNNLNSTEKKIIEEITKSRHDFRDALGKIQFNTELYYQRKENCLAHGKEIKEVKNQLEEVKTILMHNEK